MVESPTHVCEGHFDSPPSITSTGSNVAVGALVGEIDRAEGTDDGTKEGADDGAEEGADDGEEEQHFLGEEQQLIALKEAFRFRHLSPPFPPLLQAPHCSSV